MGIKIDTQKDQMQQDRYRRPLLSFIAVTYYNGFSVMHGTLSFGAGSGCVARGDLLFILGPIELMAMIQLCLGYLPVCFQSLNDCHLLLLLVSALHWPSRKAFSKLYKSNVRLLLKPHRLDLFQRFASSKAGPRLWFHVKECITPVRML